MSRDSVCLGFGSHAVCTDSIPLLVELNQLSGIAAILTYPLDVEIVEAEERDAKEEEERQKAEENGKAT